MCERHKGKNAMPVIVCGNPKFKASMKGHRPVAPKATVEYLARFFIVIMVNKHNTSKLDYVKGQMMKLIKKQKGMWLWQCEDSRIVNKNVLACLNIFQIFCCLVAHGRRPEKWTRTTAGSNSNRGAEHTTALGSDVSGTPGMSA